MVSYVSVFLGTIENPYEEGITSKFILLIISYILCGGSLLLVAQMHLKVSEAFNVEEDHLIEKSTSRKKIKIDEGKEPSKPPTALSIEQHLQQIS